MPPGTCRSGCICAGPPSPAGASEPAGHTARRERSSWVECGFDTSSERAREDRRAPGIDPLPERQRRPFEDGAALARLGGVAPSRHPGFIRLFADEERRAGAVEAHDADRPLEDLAHPAFRSGEAKSDARSERHVDELL